MVQGSVAQSEVSKPANDETAIRSVMASYNDALNSGSTAAAMALYAEDGVFMPPYSQSAVGKEAVRKAYDAVFAELKFDVKFTIAELVLMAPNWAYVRTNSAGVTRHASTAQDHGRSQSGALHFQEGRRRRMAHRALQLLANEPAGLVNETCWAPRRGDGE